MKQRYFFSFLILILFGHNGLAKQAKAKVVGANNEPLIGSVIYVKSQDAYFVTGLNGVATLTIATAQNCIVQVSCLGYEKKELNLNFDDKNDIVTIELKEDVQLLGDVSVVAQKIQHTESSARSTEKAAYLTMNVMSAQAIELSTDLDVGGVVQRISGVSIEQSGSGSGSYSIIRGMPKRYNTTLVNGLKMPSPDNRNRYVPLDLFPSGLVDRVEVYKSLSPSLEGDAVGGVVNMFMKDAPHKRIFDFNLSAGYHTLFFDHDFNTYDHSAVEKQSPYQKYGSAYGATQKDFSTENMELTTKNFVPDYVGNVVWGNRFLNHKLGMIAAASLNHEHKGNDQTRLLPQSDRLGSGEPQINNMQQRFYSNELFQFGGNVKLDYVISPKSVLKWNNFFAIMNNYQVRDGVKTRMWGVDDPNNSNVKTYETRFRTDKQQIFNSALSGLHQLKSRQKIEWALAYAFAKKELPDQGYFVRVLNTSKGDPTQLVAEDGDNERRWESNSDHDINLSLNYKKKHFWGNAEINHELGALSRLKQRESFYVHYKMDPKPGIQAYGYDWTPINGDYTYTTWEKYKDVTFDLNGGKGSTTNAMNHTAYENYLGAYYQFDVKLSAWEFLGGARLENVDMGYTLLKPKNNQNPNGDRHFFDVLPSLSIKYNLNEKSNVKGAFYQSSTKPGFFEIIPFYMPDEDEPDYKMVGNPDLKKVIAYNYDLKYDVFPSGLDKISGGVFYKRLVDPIESVLYSDTTKARKEMVRGNLNTGVAINYGAEIEVIKYVRSFGVRINYTFTNSSISTSKLSREREDPNDPESPLIPVTREQERPLQGQAMHIGNFTLLYKNMQKRWDAQLSWVYTGERIKTVSGFYNMDEWEKPFSRLDFSLEKGIGEHFKVFGRAKNILNAQYQVYLKHPVPEGNENLPLQTGVGDDYIIREDLYGMSFSVGFKYKL